MATLCNTQGQPIGAGYVVRLDGHPYVVDSWSPGTREVWLRVHGDPSDIDLFTLRTPSERRSAGLMWRGSPT